MTSVVVATGLSAPAQAQDYEISYDASLGTLPSAQGWTHVVVDPAPVDGLDETNYSVAGGALTQGPTGGPSNDDANVQYYRPPAYDYLFTEDVLQVEIRLRIVSSTVTLPGFGQPKSGFTVYLKDSLPRNVFISFGESEVFLGSTNSQVSAVVPYDTTLGFRDYVLRVDANGASLSIEGELVATLPLGSMAIGGVDNLLGIGDVFPEERGSAEIESFRFSRTDPSEPYARDLTLVSATFSSFLTAPDFSNTANGDVDCPAGTQVISGGASILSPSGAERDILLLESIPSDIGTAAEDWEADFERFLSANPFDIEVFAVCGEVPGLEHRVEPSPPTPSPPLECAPGLSQIGGRDYETTEIDYITCAESLGWIQRNFVSDLTTDEEHEINALCPVATYLIGGDARVNDFGAGLTHLGVTESTPLTLFTDQPVLWAARANSFDPTGPPASPWQLEVTIWCAPKADPTEHRPGIAGRFQGSEFGVFDDLGGNDGTFHNGAAGVSGFNGQAFEFERINQEWIELARSPKFYPQGDFTVDAWIQTDNVDPGGSGHTIVELFEPGGDPANPGEANQLNGWSLELTPNGFLKGNVFVFFPSGTAATGDVDLADGLPHHVALQRSGGDVRIFVDGAHAAETTIQNSWDGGPMNVPVQQFPDPVSIGGHRDNQLDTTSRHWEGLIDDVKFYNRGLSPEEIAEIAGCGLPLLPRVVNIDADRHGGREAARDETRLCVYLTAGEYEVELLSEATDPEARFTGWAPDVGATWNTRVEAKPEIDPDFGFGDVTAHADAATAFANTSPTTIPFTLTGDQRVHFGVEEEDRILDNRGGVSFRITRVPEPGFGLVLGIGSALLACSRRRST
ncbi:MAG: LamG domain-containing protein [bacterium]|nr:LamG domain-containing protein [bacterium]